MRFLMKILLLLACLAGLASNAAAVSAPPQDFKLNPEPAVRITTAIHQYGITWTFAEQVQYGQFANGDYYVVDPGKGVQITNISPGHDMVGSRIINGSMINPPYNGQGYDSALAAYNTNLNVGIGVSGSTPLTIAGGDSLISSISNIDIPGHTSRVKTAAVLTCLSSHPLPGSFRPGYSDPIKTIHNANDLNYLRLAKIKYPVSAPSIEKVERMFQRVWLDHIGGWTSRYLHPTDNMLGGNYGREISSDVGVGALMLHLDFPNNEKQKLLINYVQVGIDLYSIIKAGGRSNWHPDGGHASGRKWPILFAGIMLDNAEMRNIGIKSGNYLYSEGYGPGRIPPDYIHFGEDGQTFYVTQDDVNRTNSSGWRPSNYEPGSYDWMAPYEVSMIGMPEWGIRHSTHPTWDNAHWGAPYRQCCAPLAWTGFVLAARIMGAQDLWNNNALFDFQDRYMAITAGRKDPFGYVVPGEAAGWRTGGFVGDMWDTYRKDF